MSHRGDYSHMNRKHRRERDTLDALINSAPDLTAADPVVADFVHLVRDAVPSDPPWPRGQLATMLDNEVGALAPQNAPLPVGHVPAPAIVVAGPHAANTTRRSRMIDVGFTKLAGLTLAAKLALAGAALAATTTGVGATGSLPAPAQQAFDRLAGVEQNDEEDITEMQPVDEGTDATDTPAADTPRSEHRAPEPVNEAVHDVIDSTDPADRDRTFGERVSEAASRNRQSDDHSVERQLPDRAHQSADEQGEAKETDAPSARAPAQRPTQIPPVSPPVGRPETPVTDDD